jgi:CubicO group peptidase (beta-lactamase class C family)
MDLVRATLLASTGLFLAAPRTALADTQAPTTTAERQSLAGLWEAKKRFGPDAAGEVILHRTGSALIADVMGYRVPVELDHGVMTFSLPGNLGSFRGQVARRGDVDGHWIIPPSPINNSSWAAPVHLRQASPSSWTGDLVLPQDTFTFILRLRPEADGSIGAMLFNPEFDYGTQQQVSKLAVHGSQLTLLGTRGGTDHEVARGEYETEANLLRLTFDRGGTYEFGPAGSDSEFYPRGDPAPRYAYHEPPALNDGWPVSTLHEAGIDQGAIETLVQSIASQAINSSDVPLIHGLLIARHGKLVLEEYFHGEHRDKLHNLRSASKSLTSIVVGAGIQAGAPLRLSSPVYQVMNNGAFPEGLAAQKREMTLEHLLTMSSGYFCDDTNDEAPGNEETMINQTAKPDYYRYTLEVPLATEPGVNAVYCSASANLALGMLGRAAGVSPLHTFDMLVAQPLEIRKYLWPLDPAGQPYGGGSVALLPRDFLKLGQLMLNAGRWNGRQVLSPDFVSRGTSSLFHLRNVTYGYLWWIESLPYKNRALHAFAALGSGGQSVTVIPELDLVVATLGG